MTIKNVDVNIIGQTGVNPGVVYLETNNTLAEVQASGFLNGVVRKDNFNLNDRQVVAVLVKSSDNATASSVYWMRVAKVGDNYNLRPDNAFVSFDVTVGQAALASGGSVVLYKALEGEQYRVRELFLNSGGTNFSGGGGDRLLGISDGTTVYSVIPAANIQTLANRHWGEGSTFPFPASAAMNTLTVAGADLVALYSGGATDYTAGSLVLSGVLERIV